MRADRRVRLAALAALAALGTGCAAAMANRHQQGKLEGGAFTPTRGGAAQYGPDPALTCPPAGVFKVVETNVAEVAEPGKEKAGPQPDGRLCALADTLLGWPDKEPVSESVLSFLSWHFGVPQPVTRVVITTVDSEDTNAVAQRLVDPVVNYANNASVPRYGAASVRAKKGATKVALVMYDATAQLSGVPRQLAAGATASLAGQLAGGLTNPRIVVSDPSGKLDAPAQQPGQAFQAELRCGDKPGRILVEVIGEKNGGALSAARFPVDCGKAPPTSVAYAPTPKTPPDAAQSEQAVFQAMNAERAAAGLSPLQWDEAVAKVARASSEAARDEQKPGSRGSSFDVVAALKKADVMSPVVLLNPAAARSPDEAQARFATSPVHRANLMSPEATHAGVGVASYKDPDTGMVYFVSELMVRELPPVDAEALRGKLRQAVSQKRADARADKLANDPVLDEVAQKYAGALAAAKGELPKAQGDALLAPLYKSFRTVSIIGGAKPEPLEFAEEPGVVSPAKVMGVGAAGGSSAALGKNTPYVIILVGTRR